MYFEETACTDLTKRMIPKIFKTPVQPQTTFPTHPYLLQIPHFRHETTTKQTLSCELKLIKQRFFSGECRSGASGMLLVNELYTDGRIRADVCKVPRMKSRKTNNGSIIDGS